MYIPRSVIRAQSKSKNIYIKHLSMISSTEARNTRGNKTKSLPFETHKLVQQMEKKKVNKYV